VADLFIDTLPYNAHTTSSDALWAGLPVLTLMGQSFAARVAASLLNALDLSELITLTQEQYEARAVELATNPVLLKKIKAKLEQNRLTSPLFNGRLFAKHLDSAYEQIMQRYWQGLGPANLTVKPVDKDASKLESIRNEQRGIVRTPTPVVVAAAPQSQTNTSVEGLVGLQTRLEVMDIGAACIAEVPIYKRLMDRGLAHLHAFEGDERQVAKIKQTYGEHVTVYPVFLFDGSKQTVYIAAEASGMTSLLPPRIQAQKFFNGFEKFGQVLSTELLDTHRLDDVPGVPCVDFLKMDIQGAELTVLKNGGSVLQQCVAIQLEVSFVALYESQPTFGEVDMWMRSKGFMPHCFLDVKRWSIAPTIRNNNFRSPFNQLLEADIVYIRDPLTASSWSDEQLRKLILIAHDCFASTDLAIFLLLELERRYPSKAAYKNRKDHYLELVNQKVVK
jgi:FkbM family methyltransferase